MAPHEPCKFIQAFSNAEKKKKRILTKVTFHWGDRFSIWPILTALSLYMHLNLHSAQKRPIKIIAKSTRCNRALNILIQREQKKKLTKMNTRKMVWPKKARQTASKLEKCKSTPRQKNRREKKHNRSE